jgi:hypothetical protein
MPAKLTKTLPVLSPRHVAQSITTPQCANCKFWKPESNADGTKPDIGECVRYAPRPVMEFPDGRITLERRDAASRLVIWPTTEPTDYCGDFFSQAAC